MAFTTLMSAPPKFRNEATWRVRVEWSALAQTSADLSAAPSEMTFKAFCRSYRRTLTHWRRIDREQPGEYDVVAVEAIKLGEQVIQRAQALGTVSAPLLGAIHRHQRVFCDRLAIPVPEREASDLELAAAA